MTGIEDADLCQRNTVREEGEEAEEDNECFSASEALNNKGPLDGKVISFLYLLL